MDSSEIVAFLAGCFTTVMFGVVANEAFAYGPDLGRALVRRAAAWQRPQVQDEYLKAHVERIEGLKADGKLWSGAGLGAKQLLQSRFIRPSEDFFISGPTEKVIYRERQHWASIVQPGLELGIPLSIIAMDQAGFRSAAQLAFAGVVLAFAYGRIVDRSYWWPPLPRDVLVWILFGSAVAGVVVLGGWSGLFLLFALLLVVRFIVIAVRWSVYEHRWMTTEQVVETGGLFGVIFAYLPLGRIEGVEFFQTVPGRMLGYSTIVIEVESEHHVLPMMRFVADPERFKHELETRIHDPSMRDTGDEGAIVRVGPGGGVRFL